MYVPQKNGLQDAIVIYHQESNTVAQCKINPNIRRKSCIHHIRLFQNPKRFAGVGVMEMSSQPERFINDIFNYSLDAARIRSAIPFILRRASFPNGLDNLEFMKGILVKRMTDVSPISFPDATLMDFGFINQVRSNLERRTSITDRHLGRVEDTGGGKATATEVNKVLAESQVKFGLASFCLFYGLCNWAKQELMMFRQYGSRDLVKNVTDKDGKAVFPDDMTQERILGEFNIIPNVSAQKLTRELDLEVKMFLYKMFSQHPLIAKGLEPSYNLMDDVFTAAGVKKKPYKTLEEYKKLSGQESQYTPEELQVIMEIQARGGTQQDIEQALQDMKAGNKPMLVPKEKAEETPQQTPEDLLTFANNQNYEID